MAMVARRRVGEEERTGFRNSLPEAVREQKATGDGGRFTKALESISAGALGSASVDRVFAPASGRDIRGRKLKGRDSIVPRLCLDCASSNLPLGQDRGRCDSCAQGG
jgi:hypothetical protein